MLPPGQDLAVDTTQAVVLSPEGSHLAYVVAENGVPHLYVRRLDQMCITDVVIAAQPFVRAEGLMFDRSERGLMNIGTWNVPARRKTGLIENYGLLGIGDDSVTMADHEPTGGLADVDAVIAVGGMAHDPFVFFVKGVHRRPGERDPSLQLSSVGRELDVLPCSSRRALLARSNGIPRSEPEFVVPGRMIAAL
jgi:hypothetical protein